MAIFLACREIATEWIDCPVPQFGSLSQLACSLVAGGLIRQVTVTFKVTVTLVFAGGLSYLPFGKVESG